MPQAPLELPPPLVHGFGAQTSAVSGNSYQLRAEVGPGPELEEMVVIVSQLQCCVSML